MAGLRQSDAAAVARNEPRVQILLQGLDLLPDGSAGKTEMPGGGIQAAQFSHHAEGIQEARIHCQDFPYSETTFAKVFPEYPLM